MSWSNLGDIVLFFIGVFLWVAFFMVLFSILGDLFRSDDLGGGAKTMWVIVLIFLPFLGSFIYLIARGGGMGERAVATARKQQAAAADYIQSVAGGGADQIAKAKELLDAGVINQDEFETLKAKALA